MTTRLGCITLIASAAMLAATTSACSGAPVATQAASVERIQYVAIEQPTGTPLPSPTADLSLQSTQAAIGLQMTGTQVARNAEAEQRAAEYTRVAAVSTQNANNAEATRAQATLNAMSLTQTQEPIARNATEDARFMEAVYAAATATAEAEDARTIRANNLIWIDAREKLLTGALALIAFVVVWGVWNVMDVAQRRVEAVKARELAEANAIKAESDYRIEAQREAALTRERNAARAHELAILKAQSYEGQPEAPVGQTAETVPHARVFVDDPGPIDYSAHDEYTGSVLRFLEQCAELSPMGWQAGTVPPVSAWTSNASRQEGIAALEYNQLIRTMRGNGGGTYLNGYDTLAGLRRDIETGARVVYAPAPHPG